MANSGLVSSATAQNKKNPRKFYNHFLFKALIVTLSLVIVPFFPSQPPDFISTSIFSTSWELFHLIFVGIAVSYGLFSRRTRNDDDSGGGSDNNAAKFDTAQSYMSRLLHVTSAFDDELNGAAPSGSDHDLHNNNNDNDDDHVKKVQTWSSQYIRNEPMLVVADKISVLDKNSGISGEKPLLLPVRSLKSRVSDAKDGDFVSREDYAVSRVYNRSNTSPIIKGSPSNSKRFSSNDLIGLVNGEDSGINSSDYGRSNSSVGAKGFSGDSRELGRSGSVKSRGGISSGVGFGDGDREVSRPLRRSNSDFSPMDFSSISRRNSGDYGESGGGNIGVKEHEVKGEESAVLPSPIPWRSRSGRLEVKGELDNDSTTMHILPPSLEESEAARLLKPQLSRSNSSSSSPRKLSPPPNVPSPRKRSSSMTMSSESQAKIIEDYGRRKSNYSSHVPSPPPPCPRPPPPPPPPPFPTTNRSRLVKSSSTKNEDTSSSHKDLKRTVRSEPKDFGWQGTDESFSSTNEKFEEKVGNGVDGASVGKSVRTLRAGEMRPTEIESPETESPDTNSVGYNPSRLVSFSEYPQETRDFLEQVLLESDDDSESEGETYREERVETTKIDEAPSEILNDEGPDVDKKADEFIAKFREQIRLQRIESIKKSTGQLKRSSAR